MLDSIVKELPEGDVHIKGSDSKLDVVCQSVDFPQFEKIEDGKSLGLMQEELKIALSKTSFAMSKDETRYILNGTYVKCGEDAIEFVSTDGRRLAKYTLEDLKGSSKEEWAIIIPSKAVRILGKILEQGECKITFSQNKVQFEMEKITLITRLIEGEFPKYDQVIPREWTTRIKVDRARFIEAVRRASLMTTERASSVKIEVKPGEIVVSGGDENYGEDRFSAEVEGDNLTIAFNPDFLMDFLRAEESEEVVVEFTEPLKPALMKPAEMPKGVEYLYVAMPMRI